MTEEGDEKFECQYHDQETEEDYVFVYNSSPGNICEEVCNDAPDSCVDTAGKSCGADSPCCSGLTCNSTTQTCQTVDDGSGGGSCDISTCGEWSNVSCGAGGCASDEKLQERTCTGENCTASDEERCKAFPSVCGDGGGGDTCDLTTCGSWQEQSCGGGPCDAGLRYETRSCDGPNCDSSDEYRCVPDSSCDGGTTCDLSNAGISSLTASLTPLTEVNLDWTKEIPSECTQEFSYSVNRTADSTTIAGDGIGATEFTDDKDAVRENTNYNYTVAMRTNGATVSTATVSIKTGSSRCPATEGGWYCFGNNETRCDENRVIRESIPCPGEKFCTQPEAGQTACVTPTDGACRTCNFLYGMYSHAYQDTRTDYNNPDDSLGDYDCKRLVAKNICYEDRTQTAVDKLKSCEGDTACTDYSSKSTCSADPCGAGQGDESCQWREIYGEQASDTVGMGICTSTGGKSCDACESLPGGCSADKCAQLGPCYYAQDGQCKSRSELTCQDYRNQDHCEGSAYGVEVDVEYSSYGAYERISGSNAVTQPSDDTMSLGKCYWHWQGSDVGACYKNADGYAPAGNRKDCGDDRECQSDLTSPTTTVLASTEVFGKEDIVQSTVTDNVYDTGTTFFCIDRTNDCYPQDTAGQVSLDGQGTAYLRYYSIDPAKNLETVQNTTIEYDTEEPEITLVPSGTTVGQNTTVRLDVSVTEPNLDSCDVSFLGRTTTITSNSTLTYKDVTADTHTARVTCTDQAGNEANLTRDISIQENKLVDRTRPRDTVASREVTLWANTSFPGTCRWGTARDYFSMSNTFKNTGGTVHTETVTLDGGETYEYNVRCELSNGTQDIYNADPADTIRFTIDDQPPVTTAENAKIGSDVIRTRNDGVNLTCDDPAIDGREFDCETIYTCRVEGGGDCEPQNRDSTTVELGVGSDDGTYRYTFYSTDGYNKETARTLTIVKDTKAPQFANLTVTAPPEFYNGSVRITGSNSTAFITGTVTGKPVNITFSNTVTGASRTVPGTSVGKNFKIQVPISGPAGPHTIQVGAVDDLGNRNEPKSLQLLKDLGVGGVTFQILD